VPVSCARLACVGGSQRKRIDIVATCLYSSGAFGPGRWPTTFRTSREHKGAVHTLAALKPVRASRPGGYRLFVILDNLAANKTPAIRRWARRENVELCLTPANASWANPIEAHFGPLRTFVMGTSGHPNHPALARRLQACLRWRNAHARHPACWPPSAANEPASAANASNAEAAPGLKLHDQHGGPS
jgi:hypothetical protein